jgi:hypothetical protein
VRYTLWSEFLPLDELCRPALLGLLARHGVGVMAAITPSTLETAPRVVKTYHDAGVRIGLWPMLEHADGRWPSTANLTRFRDFVARLESACHGELPDDLAIDLEPPIVDLRALFAFDARALARGLSGSQRESVAGLCQLVRDVEARGVRTVAAAIPVVLADGVHRGWQRFLGTPVDEPPFSRVSPMIYTTLIEGYSRGRLRRDDALALLAVGARATRRRYRERASLSLGAVGQGVMGDETTYRSPRELAEEVAIARAAGIDDIFVFCLDGIVTRKPSEAWLEALSAEPCAAPALTARAAAAITAAVLGSRALSAGHALGRALGSG